MRRPVTTRINAELCTGCGACVQVCPSETLSLADGRAVVTGGDSMGCGHCEAVCPAGAVSVDSLDPEALVMESFSAAGDLVSPGEYDTAGLAGLMRSRRSCRTFTGDAVPAAVLRDLVRIGTTAPSGTNCQLWTFTIVPDRESVMRVGEAVGRFFKRLNVLSGKRSLRLLSKLFMKDALGTYFREYRDEVAEALREHDETGRDRLFHGAPALIAVGMRPGASCPAEDALLATQNMLLAAHAMGYETCLIGFVVEALRWDRRIKDLLGIPAPEKVFSVIALGRGKVAFRRPASRRVPKVRTFKHTH